ncbi:hypothetical protein [Mariniluteicoccus flavus]
MLVPGQPSPLGDDEAGGVLVVAVKEALHLWDLVSEVHVGLAQRGVVQPQLRCFFAIGLAGVSLAFGGGLAHGQAAGPLAELVEVGHLGLEVMDLVLQGAFPSRSAVMGVEQPQRPQRRLQHGAQQVERSPRPEAHRVDVREESLMVLIGEAQQRVRLDVYAVSSGLREINLARRKVRPRRPRLRQCLHAREQRADHRPGLIRALEVHPLRLTHLATLTRSNTNLSINVSGQYS